MSPPRVLFGHERRGVATAVSRVLQRAGFAVDTVSDGEHARQRLAEGGWDALVVDVALPKVAGYELCEQARASGDAKVVVFVASVYRRTSYKRRPTRLYGADDYVEVHHLGDQLPEKLRRHLGLSPEVPTAQERERALSQLRAEGDRRMEDQGPDELAALIVADMILYNGDSILGAASMTEAEAAVAEDLAVARDLFEQVMRAESGRGSEGDPVGTAFRNFMVAMGRPDGRPA